VQDTIRNNMTEDLSEQRTCDGPDDEHEDEECRAAFHGVRPSAIGRRLSAPRNPLLIAENGKPGAVII